MHCWVCHKIKRNGSISEWKNKSVCKNDDSDILFSLPNYHDKCGLRRHHTSKRGRVVLFTLLMYDIVSPWKRPLKASKNIMRCRKSLLRYQEWFCFAEGLIPKKQNKQNQFLYKLFVKSFLHKLSHSIWFSSLHKNRFRNYLFCLNVGICVVMVLLKSICHVKYPCFSMQRH